MLKFLKLSSQMVRPPVRVSCRVQLIIQYHVHEGNVPRSLLQRVCSADCHSVTVFEEGDAVRRVDLVDGIASKCSEGLARQECKCVKKIPNAEAFLLLTTAYLQVKIRQRSLGMWNLKLFDRHI